MKAINFSLFSIALSLLACSTKGETKNVNESYIEQAQKYIQSKIDEDKQKEGVQVLEFSKLQIDSIASFSTQKLEQIKMNKLINEIRTESSLYDKLFDIDEQYGLGASAMTKASAKKLVELGDSLNRWQERSTLLKNTDTVGYIVLMKTNLIMNDGSVKKEHKIPVIFDKEHDLSYDFNKYIYWN